MRNSENSNLTIIKRFVPFTRPYLKKYALAILLLIITSLLSLLPPFLLKIIIDDAIKNGQAHLLDLITLAMAAVIAAWATLAAVGWALLYLPHLPAGFSYSNDIPRQADFAEALYISLVALSTAGFGEIVAVHPILRLVMAFQAVAGFGLLTATVSWILQTYPALSRRRALAHQLNLFREAAGPAGIASLEARHAAALLESMAENVASVSIDLLSFHETYYFHEVEQRGSLPATLAYAHQLASEAQDSDNTELRFAGRMLYAALEDLAGVLRGKFGHVGDTSSDVFDHYELHHRHRRPPEPRG